MAICDSFHADLGKLEYTVLSTQITQFGLIFRLNGPAFVSEGPILDFSFWPSSNVRLHVVSRW